MLIATAVAEAGMAQMPVAGKLRMVLAESGGPPEGPGGLRVSATRQGASVKKLVGVQAGITSVLVVLADTGSGMPPPFVSMPVAAT
jgi:hypothetical protein